MSGSNADRPFAYRAFISYSHRDKAWADWLHKSLETWRVPARLVGKETAAGTIPRRLNPVFRDREELASATDLGRKVNEALAQSQNLIVICSPASATSRWVNEEVLAYKRMGRAERIFCLIVDGEPDASEMPGREAEECFCPALRFELDASGHPGARTEPIAADARPGKDGKANARLKLIAGMLDVGFDALKQREQRRQIRRLTALASVALVVMAVTIVLAVFALISRHQAVDARAAAERRQKQAEDLVGFMLGDLNDKLAQVSRLDIMQAVDDQAMAYFKSLPATDVSDTALEQRVRALEKIGNVRLDQGHLPAALETFDAAAKLARQLADAKPTDVARQLEYSRVLTWIGYSFMSQGKFDSALQSFTSAQDVLKRVGPRVSDNHDVMYQHSILYNDIGHVFEARGQLEHAEVQYRANLELMQRLSAASPADRDLAADLGDAHNNLGKLALMRGDLATAIAEYKADDAIETRLSLRDPSDNNQRQNTLRVRAILGRTLALAGDVTTGMRDLQEAVDMAAQLHKFDPANTDATEWLGLYSSRLARLKRLTGDLPAANMLTRQSLEALSALARQEPGNTGWQQDLAEALSEQAAQSHAAGHLDGARGQAQAALRILEPLLAEQPDDRDTVLDAVRAELLLADASVEPEVALALREKALKKLEAQKAARNDPRLLALQVQALLALGKTPDAQPLIRQLWSNGYRDLALLDLLQRGRIDYPLNPAFQRRLLAVGGQPEDTAPESQASDKVRK